MKQSKNSRLCNDIEIKLILLIKANIHVTHKKQRVRLLSGCLSAKQDIHTLS